VGGTVAFLSCAKERHEIVEWRTIPNLAPPPQRHAALSLSLSLSLIFFCLNITVTFENEEEGSVCVWLLKVEDNPNDALFFAEVVRMLLTTNFLQKPSMFI
jgi:hypothetical protein